MIMPSTGRDWKTVSGTSPVPGGISTNIKSISVQMASLQNCFTMPASRGPRQTTGSESFFKNILAESTSRPQGAVRGRIPISLALALPFTPRLCPMDGPVISASKTAQRLPRRCILLAKRPVIRDLPTPPLPLTTAITFLTLLIGLSCARKSVACVFSAAVAEGQPSQLLRPQEDALLHCCSLDINYTLLSN